MPCESCNVQFTVFKRKRLCTECRRFYCNHCLVKRNEKILCERCVVFTTRPLSKIDLQKLKPKDLIFYLQSKHISTTGCVEKEELINLVLAHANSSLNNNQSQSNNSSNQNPSAPTDDSENCSNPFDQIKQTCQNLFNSFTEKMSNDLNFDTKTSPTPSNSQQNIFNQPRAATREIPTYASSLNRNATQNDNQTSNSVPNSDSNRSNISRANTPRINTPSSSSSPSSPIISVTSISSQSLSSQQQAPPINLAPRSNSAEEMPSPNVSVINDDLPSVHSSASDRKILDNIIQDGNGSGCECSDDEVIRKFQSRYRIHPHPHSSQQQPEKLSPTSQTDSAFEDQLPGPSGSAPESGTASTSNNQKSSEESSGSSFEELGAVGGTSSDNEHWQFINKVEVPKYENSERSIETITTPSVSGTAVNSISTGNRTFQSHSNVSNLSDDRIPQRTPQRTRRLIRRRSDGVLYHHQYRIHDPILTSQLDEEESDEANQEQTARKRSRKSCIKCGKNKKSLKRHVVKFKRQLESTQMSETEIKQEVDAFLSYLENRSKESFDCSDSESNIEIGEGTEWSNRGHGDRVRNSKLMKSFTRREDDGIHVYAHDTDESKCFKIDSRFINLGDFRSSFELEDLSVKQLKEILMLNRVDYKGCCEKTELLDRVIRLWKDLQKSPAVEKLGTDDLCKICMDAPIECVILECGHMATCTNCGKVLSECPICRQYIVRVVRFFRA